MEKSASKYHVGNNGIYLYRENEYAYFLIWCPYTNQGIANLSYQIFSLNTDGDIVSYRSVEGSFSLDDEISVSLNGRKTEANNFIQEVNLYLKKSIVLVATNTEGAVYSTPYYD